MNDKRPCSPGSHPHADRPNWRPAATIEDYARNCMEGLEEYSDRRAAKLLGVSRAAIWHWKLIATIPEDLFELLLEQPGEPPSTKQLANIARVLSGHNVEHSVERCPHCGGPLRIRGAWSDRSAQIVNDWLAGQAASAVERPNGGGGYAVP